MRFDMILGACLNLHKTIYFNFRYFPIRQAIKLPVLFVSKVKFRNLRGSVKLNGKIKFAMTIVGWRGNSLYQQVPNVVVWDNHGGECVFSNQITFCNGLAIEIGEHGKLFFGENIYCGPMVRIACFDSIRINDNSRIAWEVLILDTDFHQTINVVTKEKSILTKPIVIGKNNWIGLRSFVMKGTHTPNFCITSAYSLLNKNYDIPEYSMIGGNPVRLLKSDVYRDLASHVR